MSAAIDLLESAARGLRADVADDDDTGDRVAAFVLAVADLLDNEAAFLRKNPEWEWTSSLVLAVARAYLGEDPAT